MPSKKPSRKKKPRQRKENPMWVAMAKQILLLPASPRPEELLWLSNHIGNTVPGQKLRYDFSRSGSLEEGFTDDIEMEIIKAHDDGTRSVRLRFFSGSRQLKSILPQSVNRVSGNPVLGAYMSGNVREMNRLTDGNWRYFRRRIKLALSTEARIDDITISYDGKDIAAKKISITPYSSDPGKERYPPGFAAKLYEFILAEEVPGMLYSIRVLIPAVDTVSGNQPQLEELLQVAESGN